MDNDAIIEFINITLDKIRAIPNAMDNDREVFDLFHALLLIESNFSGDPDDGFLRITLKYFDPDDTYPNGEGRLINPLYEVLKGVEGNKEMIDGFLSWVRSEIERIDGPPPPPVGGRRKSRKSRRANRKSRRANRKSRRTNRKSRRTNRKSRN